MQLQMIPYYAFCALLLYGCSSFKYDSELDMTRSAVEHNLTKDAIKKPSKADSFEVPRLAKVVALPDQTIKRDDQLVTISATDDIQLVDLLVEIGRVTNTDIVVDPDVHGGIFLNVKNRPLNEVLDRICESADLRYTYRGGIIYFELDNPYMHTYNVNFLNITRSGSSSMNASSSVLTGGSLSSGSSSSLSSSNSDTFWADFNQNISQIVNSSMMLSIAKRVTTGAPQFMGGMMGGGMGMMGGGGQQGGMGMQQGGGAAVAPAAGGGAQQGGMMGGGMGMMGGGGQQGGGQGGSQFISVNQTAGTVNIFTTQKGHKQVTSYLEKLRKKIAAQVLIEVKLVEVNLNKDFQTGIDLSFASNTSDATQFATKGFSNLANSSVSGSTSVIFGSKQSLASTVALLDTFGTTRVLDSPRITASNNQQTVLTFATNQVYFDIKVTAQPSVVSGQNATSSAVSVTSTPQTVPVGVILILQPAIDLDKGTVTLSVRPTLTRIETWVKDPGISLSAGINIKQNDSLFKQLTDIPSNQIPVTSVREIDSIMSMKDGDILVMGGFTERYKDIQENGIPFLSKIPILGRLFSSRSESTKTKEIVMLIKTTIIREDQTNVDEYDRFFYKKFFNDPRELEL